MKKKALILGVFAFTLFAAPITSFAARVLNYEWKCVGSGGSCLDTVVVVGKRIQ